MRPTDGGSMSHTRHLTQAEPRSSTTPGRLLLGIVLVLLGPWFGTPAQAAIFGPGPLGDLALELFDNRSQAQLLGQLERATVSIRPSPRAQRLAREIPSGSGPLARAYQAIALGQLEQAEQLLGKAQRASTTSTPELDFIAAEIASYAGHSRAALEFWQRTLATGSKDPVLNAAAATSLMVADPRAASEQQMQTAIQELLDDPAAAVDRRLAIRVRFNLARLVDGKLADLDRVLSDYLDTRRKCSDCAWDRRLPDTQRMLAAVRKAQGRFDEAELLYKQALEWVASAPRNQRADYPEAELRLDLARHYGAQGRLAEAEQVTRDAGVAFEDGLPADVAGLDYLRALALDELKAGRPDDARRALDRAEALIESAGLAIYPWQVEFLGVRSLLSLRKGEATRAEIEQRRALSLSENELGPADPRIGDELLKLSNIFLAQGRPEEALERMEAAIKIEREWPRRDPRREARLLFRMGTIYLQLGASSPSIDIFDLLEDRSGKSEKAKIRYQQGGIYLELGTVEQTMAVFEDLLRLDQDYPDSIDPTITGAGKLILGNLYAQQARYAEAQPLLVSGLLAWEQQAVSGDPRLVSGLNSLGMVNWKLGRLSEAEQAYLRAGELLAAARVSAGPELDAKLQIQAKLGLGRVYVKQGEHELALEQLHQALRMTQQKFNPEDPLTAEIRGLILSTERRQNRPEAAETGAPAPTSPAKAQ